MGNKISCKHTLAREAGEAVLANPREFSTGAMLKISHVLESLALRPEDLLSFNPWERVRAVGWELIVYSHLAGRHLGSIQLGERGGKYWLESVSELGAEKVFSTLAEGYSLIDCPTIFKALWHKENKKVVMLSCWPPLSVGQSYEEEEVLLTARGLARSKLAGENRVEEV